jgi:YidC/Oxa1 family membrane protein insertase
MKNNKFLKIIMIFSLSILLSLFLVSCSSTNTVFKVLINTPDTILYESTNSDINPDGAKVITFEATQAQLKADFPAVKKANELSVYSFTKVSETNALDTLNLGYSITTYTISAISTAPTELHTFVKYPGFDSHNYSENTILFLDVRYKTKKVDTKGIITTAFEKGYTNQFGRDVTKDQLQVRAINGKGQLIELANDDYTLTTADNYDKTIIDGGLYSVVVNYKGLSSSITNYVAGGQKPIVIFKSLGDFIDFILVSPIAFVANFFGFGGSLALCILLTTVFIRTITWPVYTSSFSVMNRMTELQPQQQKIQDKYRGRTDQNSKMQMQMEVQALMKKNHVNIFGCIALQVLNMIVFSAMWQVVTRIAIPHGTYAAKFTNTKLFGIDLTTGANSWRWDHLILILVMIITQVGYQLFTQSKPNYKKKTLEHYKPIAKSATAMNPKVTKIVMLVVMAGMFTFISFGQINTMALYWIFGNTYTLLQNVLQRYLDKRAYFKKQAKEGLGGL